MNFTDNSTATATNWNLVGFWYTGIPVHIHGKGKYHLCNSDSGFRTEGELPEGLPPLNLEPSRLTALCGRWKNVRIQRCEKEHAENWKKDICKNCLKKQGQVPVAA